MNSVMDFLNYLPVSLWGGGGGHRGQRSACRVSSPFHHRHSKGGLGSPGFLTGFLTCQAILLALLYFFNF